MNLGILAEKWNNLSSSIVTTMSYLAVQDLHYYRILKFNYKNRNKLSFSYVFSFICSSQYLTLCNFPPSNSKVTWLSLTTHSSTWAGPQFQHLLERVAVIGTHTWWGSCPGRERATDLPFTALGGLAAAAWERSCSLLKINREFNYFEADNWPFI